MPSALLVRNTAVFGTRAALVAAERMNTFIGSAAWPSLSIMS